MPSPTVSQKQVYLLRDRGEVECLDPLTGKTVWKDSLPKSAANYYGSTVIAGDKLYAVREDGAILLRRRADRGLLGGMTEVPGSEWTSECNAADAVAKAPIRAEWQRLPGVVTHVFTHFRLELIVFRADVAPSCKPPAGMWWAPAETLPGEALPSVMRKVVEAAGPLPEEGARRLERVAALFRLSGQISAAPELPQEKAEGMSAKMPSAAHRAVRKAQSAARAGRGRIGGKV